MSLSTSRVTLRVAAGGSALTLASHTPTTSPRVVQAPFLPAEQPAQQPPRAAALSEAGEEMLLRFFAVKDTPSSEEIRFLARRVSSAGL